MISVSGNTFQFRAKEKRKVPQEHNFCARLLDWLRNLRKAVQEMTFVPAPMCPCQDRLSYLRSDHMLVRFLIARQLGTWSFAGPATDDNRCRSGSTPPQSPRKMVVHVCSSDTSGGMWRKRLRCWKATTGAPQISDVAADGHIMMSSASKLQTNHAASWSCCWVLLVRPQTSLNILKPCSPLVS
jgi:hypothetical protein